MKHYKSVEFLSIFRMSSPLAQTQSPPAETQRLPTENFLATVLAFPAVWLTFAHLLTVP